MVRRAFLWQLSGDLRLRILHGLFREMDRLWYGFLYLRLHHSGILGCRGLRRTVICEPDIGLAEASVVHAVVHPGEGAVGFFLIGQVITHRTLNIVEAFVLRERHMVGCIDGEIQRIHELDAVDLQIGGELIIALIGGGDLERLEVVVSEIEEISCIAVLRVVSIQDDTDQRHAVAFTGGYQCVAGEGRVPGLTGEHTRIVIREGTAHHMVMGVNRVFRCIRVRILVDRRMGIDLRRVDRAEGVVLNRVLHDLCEIRRTGIVLRIIQTRRVCKM